jgi:hypothetical protein
VLLAADERRRELDDGVAAVVGPAHQAGEPPVTAWPFEK